MNRPTAPSERSGAALPRGVLCVDKPSGISSYDVIRRLKPLLPRRTAIGHAGTLDPLACGVLLVLVGAATRVSRFLLGADKTYEAGIRFGIRTDTDDITGHALATSEIGTLTRDDIIAHLARFVGTITQVPPSFSAIKQQGTPLYELARKGEPASPEPRVVTIHELELLDWCRPRARIRCRVSSGTYVRALARDIGTALDVPATLESLVRTASGRFELSRANRLEAITGENLGHLLVPIPEALADLPLIHINPEAEARLRHGRPAPTGSEFNGTGLAIAGDEGFLAVVTGDGSTLRVERLVYAD